MPGNITGVVNLNGRVYTEPLAQRMLRTARPSPMTGMTVTALATIPRESDREEPLTSAASTSASMCL